MLNVGVVGVGVWGCHSLEKGLAATGHARIRAVSTCERWGAHHFRGDAVAFGRRYAAELDAEFVEDWRILAARRDIDVLSVMVCPRHKAEVIEAALAAGKHVLTDKPLAMNAREAARLAAVESHSAGRGFVLAGYQDRPLVRQLIRERSAGHFGRTRMISVRLCFVGGIFPDFIPTRRWRHETPSGELTTIGCHALMTIMRLHPVPVKNVSAMTATLFYEEYASVGAEDWAQANLTFADGAVASMIVARLPQRLSEEDFGVRMSGTHGHARLENDSLVLWPGEGATQTQADNADTVHDILCNVANAFENNAAPPVTITDAWRLQCILEAALKSARTETSAAVHWPRRPPTLDNRQNPTPRNDP